MISGVFIRRPVTAMVISILMTIMGLISIVTLPISQYPDIAPPTVSVQATYTGADAETVEETVTTPLEAEINGVPGMIYLQSNSTSDGMSRITVTFEVGTDIDIATVEVQNRVGIAEPILPASVRQLGIITRKASQDALMMIALISPDGSRDANFLSNYSHLHVRDAIQRVHGVGDVLVFGQPFSMRVWLDATKLSHLALTTEHISAAIEQQNIRIPGGRVGTRPQPESQVFEFPVITDSHLTSVEDFEKIIVKTNPDGSLVLLKDVARIELGQFMYDTFMKLNGGAGSGMLVNQMPGGNAVETEQGILKALAELKENFPPGVDYAISYETVSVVYASIQSVIRTMLLALLLVSVVVFFFLQNWRSTIIPVLTIPVSVVATFIAFNIFDLSINNLTMLALIMAIGIVVDDAIVVVETVQHYIDEEQMDAKKATLKGMKDITAPIIAICLVLTAVFVPVGFISGMVGKLYQQFATTIAVSVVLSTVVALTLTPALCAILLKPTPIKKESTGLNKLFYRFNGWLERTTDSYGNGVRHAIKATPVTLIVLLVLFAATAFLFFKTPTGFIPEEDTGLFMIGVSLPEGASSTRTDLVLDEIRTQLEDSIPEINYFTQISGRNIINQAVQPSVGSFYIALVPWGDRSRSSVAIMDRINDIFKEYEKADVVITVPPPIPGMGATGGFSLHLQNRRELSMKEFESTALDYIGKANKEPAIGHAYTLFNTRTPNYKIDVNREQAMAMGVPINSIYHTLSTYFGSTYVNDFTLFGRNFRVVTQADTMYRMGIDDIKNLYLDNSQGNPVPLSTLVSYKLTEAPAIINHFNIFRSIEVRGEAATSSSSGDALLALKDVASDVLGNDLSYAFAGTSLQEEEAGNQALLIFSLCIILVFFVLAALYESWSVPFSVMLSVPLGAFGSILTLYLVPNMDNNIFAQIGLITIIGLSAKNAILIVEFAKERLDRGMELIDATIEAVKLRLRPIMMTSISFILGVLPLLFSSGAVAISTQTIGWTVFGGMTAATFLPIFIVPVLYVAITRLAYGQKKLDELQKKKKKKKKK